MKIFLYLILIYFFNTHLANAGGPWDNQYCNIKTTTIKTIDKNEKGDVLINGKPLLRFRIIK